MWWGTQRVEIVEGSQERKEWQQRSWECKECRVSALACVAQIGTHVEILMRKDTSDLSEQKRGFHDLLRQKLSSLFILGWSWICHLPDDMIHISGFGEEDALSQTDVLCCGYLSKCSSWFCWLLFQTGVNQMACLSYVNLIIITGDTVCSQCPQSHILLDWSKQTRDFPLQEAAVPY